MNEKDFKDLVMGCLNESIDAFAKKIDDVLARGMIDVEAADIIEAKAVAKGILMSEANQFSVSKEYKRRFEDSTKRVREFVIG